MTGVSGLGGGEGVNLELCGLAEAVGLLSHSGWEHMGSLWGAICHSLAFVHVIRKVEMLIHFFFFPSLVLA